MDDPYPNLEKENKDIIIYHNIKMNIKKSIFTFQSIKNKNCFGFLCYFRDFPQNNLTYILTFL